VNRKDGGTDMPDGMPHRYKSSANALWRKRPTRQGHWWMKEPGKPVTVALVRDRPWGTEPLSGVPFEFQTVGSEELRKDTDCDRDTRWCGPLRRVAPPTDVPLDPL
jgi:hypothetical protein